MQHLRIAQDQAIHGSRRLPAQELHSRITSMPKGRSSGLYDLQPLLDNFTSCVLEPVDLLIHHIKEHSVPSRLAPV